MRGPRGRRGTGPDASQSEGAPAPPLPAPSTHVEETVPAVVLALPPLTHGLPVGPPWRRRPGREERGLGARPARGPRWGPAEGPVTRAGSATAPVPPVEGHGEHGRAQRAEGSLGEVLSRRRPRRCHVRRRRARARPVLEVEGRVRARPAGVHVDGGEVPVVAPQTARPVSERDLGSGRDGATRHVCHGVLYALPAAQRDGDRGVRDGGTGRNACKDDLHDGSSAGALRADGGPGGAIVDPRRDVTRSAPGPAGPPPLHFGPLPSPLGWCGWGGERGALGSQA